MRRVALLAMVLALLSAWLASPGMACTKPTNPDQTTSVLFEFGAGNVDGVYSNADLMAFRFKFLQPLTDFATLQVGYEGFDSDWHNMGWRDARSELFTLGFKIYLR